MSIEALKALQEDCVEINKIRSGDRPKFTKFEDAEIDGTSLLCEVSSFKPRPYVPPELRSQVMTGLHFDHLGIKSTTKRVAEDFYWPSLKGDVENFVKNCNTCSKVKANKKQANTGKFEVPDKRFSHVLVDIVGPLPESYGYKYLLTAICRTTRFLHAWPLKEASSSEAATAFLQGYVPLMGVPAVLTSDNGVHFTSGLWKNMM